MNPGFPSIAYLRHAALWKLVEPSLPPGELAHDRHHIERVYVWAMRLAPEADVSADIAGATALVHDLVFIPKNSADRAKGGERSAVMAGELLQKAGYSQDECAQISEAVRTSSWSRGLEPTTALGAVLQDADRLDAIGALGIARTFACAQFMSSPEAPGRFYDRADPLAQSQRPLTDRQQAVDHFFAKLLKLKAGMHFPGARKEAEIRHNAMAVFLEQLGRELSH
jgi:uncharacterized protein